MNWKAIGLWSLFVFPCFPGSGERAVETIVPALQYGGGCSSVVELKNLGQNDAAADVEAHREEGALTPLSGAERIPLRLAPGEAIRVEAQIQDETNGAWVRIREMVHAGGQPVIAIRGSTSCISHDSMRTVAREVAYAMKNPWLSAEVADIGEESVLAINISERAAKATVCYSSGVEFSVPGHELKPVCSSYRSVLLPPFGSRTFAVHRGGNTNFELRTSGDQVVLQTLRAMPGGTTMFSVDSSISFGSDESSHR